jgi:hypothetical protein
VTDPESALDRARAAAAAMRADGAYGEEPGGAQLAPAEELTMDKLLEWAVIDPDLRDVRSTRRFGAPMTAVKRGLLRLLGQYHAALLAEQTRFNVNLLRYLERLEQRLGAIEAIEERVEQRDGDSAR